MCGIAAILLAPQPRPAAVWPAIKNVFIQNLVFNQKRGEAATGVAVVQQNGQVQLEKLAAPATEFVQSRACTNLLNQIDDHTTLLLGHTRAPTKGSPDNYHNNHPLQTGPVCGIHNGHIHNDDDLFTRLKLLRQAQVDSEIIFRLLEQYSPLQLNHHYLAAIQPEIQRLQGKFTFLAVDQRAAGNLLVVKHQNPLSVYYHPQWNVLVFSSSYLFLRKTFGQSAIYQTLPHDQLLYFEAHTLATHHYRPAAHQALFSPVHSDNGKKPAL